MQTWAGVVLSTVLGTLENAFLSAENTIVASPNLLSWYVRVYEPSDSLYESEPAYFAVIVVVPNSFNVIISPVDLSTDATFSLLLEYESFASAIVSPFWRVTLAVGKEYSLSLYIVKSFELNVTEVDCFFADCVPSALYIAIILSVTPTKLSP